MNHDPNENQGRGPKPKRVSITEWVFLIAGAALLAWVVLAAVGASK